MEIGFINIWPTEVRIVEEEPLENNPNYFTNYLKTFLPFNPEGNKPRHLYTIEIH